METITIKLLAIDNNKASLTDLKAVAEDALPGCTLLTALNGPDGIGLARTGDPEVILLDIDMPAMDGFEVCRQLKTDSRLRLIPVVFLTEVKPDRENRLHALDGGADAILSKPLDRLELAVTVRAMAKIKAANRRQQMEKEDVAAPVAERTRELNEKLTERNQAELLLKQSENRYRELINLAVDGILIGSHDGTIIETNEYMCAMVGLKREEIVGRHISRFPFSADSLKRKPLNFNLLQEGKTVVNERTLVRPDASEVIVEMRTKMMPDGTYQSIYRDITGRKQMERALEQRIVALTRPLDQSADITFDDLFDLSEIQRIQNEFSNATGVTSVILRPDSTEITAASNMSHFCSQVVRTTEKGFANCVKSDLFYVQSFDPKGPIVHRCPATGLWDGCVSVVIGERHIANWMIGQVRDETQTEEEALRYAREIGADEQVFLEAYRKLPCMSGEHFKQIAQALFTLANQLSTSAYQNIQQARFIAEKQKAEKDLLRLSAAVNQMVEAVVVTDAEGLIQYVNPAFETITGHSAAETIGKSPRIMKSGRHEEPFYGKLWQTISSGQTWKGQFINKRKNGSLYNEEATISPVCDPDGTIRNYVAVKRDISEELRKEEEFRQAQKMEAVGQLAGGIAHDFNNILQAIVGFSEFLIGKLKPDTSEYQDAAEIRKAAFRAAELTSQLLVFSRKKPAEKTQISLNSVVRDSEILIHLLLGSHIASVFDLAQDLPEVQADPGQITQILMNLAINSRDAMPGGGQLTVRTENIRLTLPDTATVPGSKAGEFVCLSVTDTGQGMSREVQDHLFEPFFTTKAPEKGTGLGLSVVYGIIKQHKGWINVYSEEGKGATFKVYFPACEAAVPHTARSGGPAGKHPGHIHPACNRSRHAEAAK